MLALQTIVRPGDKVVVVSPVWPNIVAAVKIAGGAAWTSSLEPLPEGGFHLDMDAAHGGLRRQTRAIFVNSPGNPTRLDHAAEDQQALLDFCRRAASG